MGCLYLVGCTAEPTLPLTDSNAPPTDSSTPTEDALPSDTNLGTDVQSDATQLPDSMNETIEDASASDDGGITDITDALSPEDTPLNDDAELMPDSQGDVAKDIVAQQDAESPLDILEKEDVATAQDIDEPDDIADETDVFADAIEPLDTVLEDIDEDGMNPEDTGWDVADPVDTGPVLCDPPLKLEADTAIVEAFGLAALTLSGGTGNYLLSLTENNSGAQVNQGTAYYMAGSQAGVVDVIELTDLECEGAAELAISVVAPLSVSPKSLTIPPNSCVTFDVQGGSGQVTFEIIIPNAPSGSLSPEGQYTAGPQATSEVIFITDNVTGEYAQIPVTVTADAFISIEPKVLMMPVGAQVPISIKGGSGTITYDLPEELASLKDGVVTANAPGSVTVKVTDPAVGCMGVDGTEKLQATLDLVVAKAHDVPAMINSRSNRVIARSGYDIDGDGYEDAILGVPDAHFSTISSGAVIIYRGTAEGLDPIPARVISVTETGTRFGESLALGDFNDDGKVDLAVGAPYAKLSWHERLGMLRVYYGVEDGFFEAQPSMTVYGDVDNNSGWQRFTQGLAACDLNGDGLMDLAVGAPDEEDSEIWPLVANMGAIYVYFGSDKGLPEMPSQSIYGYVPDGPDTWAYPAKGGMGTRLAPGDFNGDGICDLATSNNLANPPNGGPTLNDGMAAIYLGNKESEESPGGLSPYPHRYWLAIETEGMYDSQFGDQITVGDLDSDGLDDLVVSQSRGGYIRIFTGASMAGEASDEVEKAASADLSIPIPEYDSIRAIIDFRVGYVTDDAWADLIVGFTSYEATTGAIQVYSGQETELPHPEATFVLPSTMPGERLGSTMTLLTDNDGDDVPDFLVYAYKNDALGEDVGLPYYLSGSALLTAPKEDEEVEDDDAEDEEPAVNPFVPLGYPVKAADGGVGKHDSFALLDDIDGDGLDDLAVGASKTGSEFSHNSGNVYLFTADQDPDKEWQDPLGLAGHTGHYVLYNVAVGGIVASLGDFDGDGVSDLATSRSMLGGSDTASLASKAVDGELTLSHAGLDWSQKLVFEDACDDKWAETMDPTPWVDFHWAWTVLWSGQEDGLGDPPTMQPRFIFPTPGQYTYLDGGIDMNGDGLQDLLLGAGHRWNLTKNNYYYGGVALIYGRESEAGDDIQVICRPDWGIVGRDGSTSMGEALTRVGDLDGDGCDEAAVTESGRVRIVYGFGPACAHEEALQTTVAFTNVYGGGDPIPMLVSTGGLWKPHTRGFSIAGGADVDGDGIPDLVVGAPNYDEQYFGGGDNDYSGAVWFLPGSWLKDLDTEPATSGPEMVATALTEFPASLILSPQQNIKFGYDVALIPNYYPDGRAAVAVSALNYAIGATQNVGAVLLYEHDPTTGALNKDPFGIIAGETYRPGGHFGTQVSARIHNGKMTLAVGADTGTAYQDPSAIEYGTLYLFPVDK